MNDEILVHISTPATRKNDDLFRSLTAAYTEFVPRVRYREEPRYEAIGPEPSVGSEGGLPWTDHVETSMLSTSKDSYGSFPSHLFSGGQADNQSDGSVPTGSRLARLDRIQARWMEQITPKSTFVMKEQQSNRGPHSPKDFSTAFIEDTQLGAQALQSQLHDSHATTSEGTSNDEASSEASQPEKNLAQELGEVTGSTSTEVPVVPNRFSSVHARAQESRTVDLPTNPPDSSKPTPRTARVSKYAPTSTEPAPLSQEDFSKLPTDAYPPAPKITVECPGKLPSQITKHLAAIKVQNPKRFKPSAKRRAPKHDDRGYWMVDCSGWPTSLQHEFWTALCENVASGRLGWGTTLHRENSSSDSLGVVRLYSWAEVVEHMWLLLWLCSRGHIAGSSSRWIDADGKAVFEVL
ncbi:hypothetical protein EK21DRAFT_66474 [Setomelanomma holmii]|uniref:Uncharacterized protein n=1 Tax=Setomelanomma holmii TaxID=210430 RepID=A0A9P4H9I4_9PLEO|nr:hypothetical protein EK21DRAFT_66474 [Setomelanomma holmii]